jgi:serine protease Do
MVAKALCSVVLGFAAVSSKAEPPSITEQVQQIYNQSKSAIVRIEAEDELGKLVGTGFFIDPNGTIYTSYSVGGDCHNITVEFGSNRYPAKILASDPKGRVALLKVQTKTPWLPLGRSDDLKVATPVMSIGYPPSLPVTPELGIVGGIDGRDPELADENRGYFQTSLIRANIITQQGESGAPLLNLQGQVVGIVIGGIHDRTSCYALPIKAAEKLRTDYLRFGQLKPGRLGVNVERSNVAVRDSTIVISGISSGSPAEKANLQTGDTILQIGTIKIKSLPDMFNASFFLTANQPVPVTILRNGKEITATVNPSDDPIETSANPPLLAPASPPLDLQLTPSSSSIGR